MNTEVKILGKSYSVRSEFDPAFTNETADFVNGKMRELMGKAGTLPTEKIAVLTAMNLAGELLRLKKKDSGLNNVLRDKAKRLLKLIDANL
ncbi:MAG: cell division protein ZapA [Pseudomonadota bacterium]